MPGAVWESPLDIMSLSHPLVMISRYSRDCRDADGLRSDKDVDEFLRPPEFSLQKIVELEPEADMSLSIDTCIVKPAIFCTAALP